VLGPGSSGVLRIPAPGLVTDPTQRSMHSSSREAKGSKSLKREGYKSMGGYCLCLKGAASICRLGQAYPKFWDRRAG
jgi:hypothetical protein